MAETSPNAQHDAPAGVYDVLKFQTATACSMGQHVWVPWLRLETGSCITWCVHCRHQEQYDS